MTLLADALYEVTGRRLALDFTVGENGGDERGRTKSLPARNRSSQLMKQTFDAREVDE